MAVKELAAALLAKMSGAARVLHSGYRPVSLNGHFLNNVEGTTHAVVEVGTAEARSHASFSAVVVSGDEPVPAPRPLPPPGVPLLQLARQDPNVAEALRLIGNADVLDWFVLYKLYEIVRDDVRASGQRLDRTARKLKWASGSDLDAFTASADRPDVSGGEARHARMSGSAPSRTMTLPEARQFMLDLVRKWMNWRASGQP
jgi:hypothetical protein